MGHVLLAEPSLGDAAVLTAGSAAAELPVTNLQATPPDLVWRALDLDNAHVVADLGTAKAIDLVWLGYTNASASAAARVRGAVSEAALTSNPGYDSGMLPLWPTLDALDLAWTDPDDDPARRAWGRMPLLHLPPAAQAWRWWRIDVADAANPDGYFQAGRLYLARAWQPAQNIDYGWSHVHVDESPAERAAGGGLSIAARRQWRQRTFELKAKSEADIWDNAVALERRFGASGDLLFLHDPEATGMRVLDGLLYGRMTEAEPIVQLRTRVWRKRITFEEWELP